MIFLPYQFKQSRGRRYLHVNGVHLNVWSSSSTAPMSVAWLRFNYVSAKKAYSSVA